MKLLHTIISRLCFWRREAGEVEKKDDGVRDEIGLVGFEKRADEPGIKSEEQITSQDDFVDALKKQWKI